MSGSDGKIRLLIVDDETGILETLGILFRGEGDFEVQTEARGQDAIRSIEEDAPDVVLSDIRMPGTTGLEVLAAANEADPELPVILMTAQASLQSAMEAVNRGAYYYIQKPFQNEELVALVRRASEARVLKKENRELKKRIGSRDAANAARPVGQARSFTQVIDLAETVAPTDSTILLSGESGAGKEVVARWIHALSDRSTGAFYSVNCGALPESLLESELFGHMKGSFTGAVKDKEGLLVAAGGGTLFLDEIGEMTPATQVKLLRVLQEREVIPVGSTEPVAVDVRVVAATNRELEEEIRRGRFRQDLYYRLNVIALHLPPLRDRKDDIPLLIDHFLDGWEAEGDGRPQVGDAALEVMLEYDWPGNVRELQNALERAVVVAQGKKIEPDHLPERVRETRKPRIAEAELPPNPSMEVIERAYIEWVLKAEEGNKTRAAEVLGIDPSTLYRKLNRYGIDA